MDRSLSRIFPAIFLCALLVAPVPAVVVNQMPACSDRDFENKDLDLIVYGASGFTGRHATYFLASHPNKPKWAMAGRSPQKLAKISAQLGDEKRVEMITVRLNDEPGLYNMTRRARAIISFAGPYEESGSENLIRAALFGCAHYIDVSTETTWKREMLLTHGPSALARGVAVVQGAGFQSLISDFLAVSVAEDYSEQTQKPPLDIKIIHTRMNGGRQGGRRASETTALARHGLQSDPYALVPDILPLMKVDVHVDGANWDGKTFNNFGYQPKRRVYLKRHPVAISDCPVVRQSLNRAFPKDPITVLEGVTTSVDEELKHFVASHRGAGPEDFPLNPAVGKGPPIWVRMEGSFMAEAIATRNADSTDSIYKRVSLIGNGDPSNIGTTKLAVTLALGLVELGPKDGHGGFFTPALALGTKELEQRLNQVDYGTFMNITHGDIP